jgi:hypothetical protein
MPTDPTVRAVAERRRRLRDELGLCFYCQHDKAEHVDGVGCTFPLYELIPGSYVLCHCDAEYPGVSRADAGGAREGE